MTQKQYDAIRYGAYTIELFLLFMLQQTPWMIPKVLGGRPILLIPAVIVIAMYETNVTSMAFGIFAGFLLDYAAGAGFGFYAIILAVFCFILSTLCTELIQTSFVAALAAGAVLIGAVVLLQWLILFVGKGYDYAVYAFTRHFISRFFYTALFIPPLYYLNRFLAIRINPVR